MVLLGVQALRIIVTVMSHLELLYLGVGRLVVQQLQILMEVLHPKYLQIKRLDFLLLLIQAQMVMELLAMA